MAQRSAFYYVVGKEKLYSITVPILTKAEKVVLITRRLRKRKVSRSQADQATRASHPGDAVCLSASRRIRSIVLACRGSSNFLLKDVCNADLKQKVSDGKLWASTAN